MRAARLPLALLAAACLVPSILAGGAAAAKKLPNLKTTKISNPPALAHAGDNIPVSNKIKNAGRREAGKSTARFYLSPGRKLGAGAVPLVGDEKIGKLAAGATAQASGSFAIDRDTPDGTYYLIGCADAKRKVQESNEKDNCLASSSSIVVQGF
jgi:subtilase family serine protease